MEISFLAENADRETYELWCELAQGESLTVGESASIELSESGSAL